MHNLLKNKVFYFICIGCFIAGIAVGLPFSCEKFSFAWKIELFDIISLIATIILAVYVASSLETRVQDDRIEKELHISQIGQIEALLEEIEKILRADNIIYNDVNYRISLIRKKKNSIFEAINSFDVNKDFKLKQYTEKISSSIDILKRLLTETSVDKSAEVIMKDGILNYSAERLTQINNEIDTLENDLFRFKIIINRS